MVHHSERNCSGLWHGRYTYRADDQGVPFTARLQQDADRLQGDIAEVATQGPSSGHTISASISGRVSRSRVTFLKAYDVPDEAYDSVSYDGDLSADGLEIGGTWRLVGTPHTGTFLMIRDAPVSVEEALTISVRD